MNARSLKGKTIELSAITYNSDIVCITETHINETIKNHQIFDYSSKLIYRKDRNIHGGGVLIAVNEELLSTEMDVQNPDSTELIFVRIDKKIIIGCYYRPQHNRCFKTLTNTLEEINSKYPKDDIILVGDMNLPGIDWYTWTDKCRNPD